MSVGNAADDGDVDDADDDVGDGDGGGDVSVQTTCIFRTALS